MLQLTKNILTYQDENYSHAVNYESSLYNFPITLNYGEKHNRTKYILSAGTSDHIELWQDGVYIYVLAQNNGLSYISLMCINTELKEVESCYLGPNDCIEEEAVSFGILDMNSEAQIKLLCEYL